MGCGRSKFHSQNEPETNGKSKTIDTDNDKNSDNNEFENAKFRMRRCTPAINTNGGLQPSDFTFSNQNKALVKSNYLDWQEFKEKFSSKPFGNKNMNAPQILRVTNSQLEFFKMLDEKIEQGSCSSDEEDIISFRERQFSGEIIKS